MQQFLKFRGIILGGRFYAKFKQCDEKSRFMPRILNNANPEL